MTPSKQAALGMSGCVLVPGPSNYRLKDGTWTHHVAVTVSLRRAEPCLRKFPEGTTIRCEEATALGYRLVRSYDDAVMFGLA